MSLSEDMGGIWSDSKRRCELVSRERRQQSITREIEAIEACVYCYIDSRLQCLLLPYARKEYPWDTDCDILPHFRNNMNYQPKSCYHCLKGQLQDHLSCTVLDKLYNKTTHRCQCEIPSSEDSEMSIGQITEDKSDQDETGYEDDYNSHWGENDLSSNSVNFDLSTSNLTETDVSGSYM